jgi:hypothetical protein
VPAVRIVRAVWGELVARVALDVIQSRRHPGSTTGRSLRVAAGHVATVPSSRRPTNAPKPVHYDADIAGDGRRV